MSDALRRVPVGPVRILAVPCGLPRDLSDLAAALSPDDRARIHYHGLDIDPELLRLGEKFTAHTDIGARIFHKGDALDPAAYPRRDFDVIVSTGLGEFLNDDQLVRFYSAAHAALASGGVFYTSATRREPRSEAMLRAYELNTHYRTEPELRSALAPLGWSRMAFTTDPTGLQTFVRAIR
jgi:SAM-dependent methyltransferase